MSRWTPEAIALSGQLRQELGQDANDGILGECWVRSKSEPGKQYRMVRSRSGWQHPDQGCRSWQIRGHCWHVEELMGETEHNALIIAPRNALAIIDELEDRAIVEAMAGKVSETWVYEFTQDGKQIRGLSAVGVENAAREAAKKGEAIREIDIRIEYEDENEARFVARAGRYAIGDDGREVLLDVAIRAKRVSKFQGRDHKPNPNWYEHGITKAARNAKLALLPAEAVASIMAAADKAKRVRRIEPERAQQPQRPSIEGEVVQPEPLKPPSVKVPSRADVRDAIAAQKDHPQYVQLLEEFKVAYPETVAAPDGKFRPQNVAGHPEEALDWIVSWLEAHDEDAPEAAASPQEAVGEGFDFRE